MLSVITVVSMPSRSSSHAVSRAPWRKGRVSSANTATCLPFSTAARMTGAGFGGCAVALVNADGTGAFAADVRNAYGAGELYVCRAVAGAHIVE